MDKRFICAGETVKITIDSKFFMTQVERLGISKDVVAELSRIVKENKGRELKVAISYDEKLLVEGINMFILSSMVVPVRKNIDYLIDVDGNENAICVKYTKQNPKIPHNFCVGSGDLLIKRANSPEYTGTNLYLIGSDGKDSFKFHFDRYVSYDKHIKRICKSLIQFNERSLDEYTRDNRN